MRVQQREGERPEVSGALSAPPVVSIDVCRCGRTHDGRSPHEDPDWPLAQAWTWLTDVPAGLDDDLDEPDPDPASLPWWDARSRPGRRRAILPLVLLGELQAGVLLRALWQVLQSPPGPGI